MWHLKKLTGEDQGNLAAKCHLYTFGFQLLSCQETGRHNGELSHREKWIAFKIKLNHCTKYQLQYVILTFEYGIFAP